MYDLLVKDSDELIISVVIGKTLNGSLIAGADQDVLAEEHNDIDAGSLKTLDFVFQQPNFKNSVEIAKDMFKTEGTGVEFNPLAIRYSKMVRLLKKWDLKDEDGQDLEINETNISKLHPAVANAVGVQLDEHTPMF